MKRMIVTFDLDSLPESTPRIDALLQLMDAEGLDPMIDSDLGTVVLPLNTFFGEFEDDIRAEDLVGRVREVLGDSGFEVGSMFAAALGDDVAYTGEIVGEDESPAPFPN